MMKHNFLQELSGYVQKRLNNYSLRFVEDIHGLTINVDGKDLFNIISFFHHDTYCQFESIIDMYITQGEEKTKRFLVYVLMSYEKKVSIRISVPVAEYMSSVWDLYKSATWLERQIWETEGIVFKGHRDLRHLFTSPILNACVAYSAGGAHNE